MTNTDPALLSAGGVTMRNLDRLVKPYDAVRTAEESFCSHFREPLICAWTGLFCVWLAVGWISLQVGGWAVILLWRAGRLGGEPSPSNRRLKHHRMQCNNTSTCCAAATYVWTMFNSQRRFWKPEISTTYSTEINSDYCEPMNVGFVRENSFIQHTEFIYKKITQSCLSNSTLRKHL